MADLSDLQAASFNKLVGSDLSGNETNAVNSDTNGNLFVKDYATSATGSAVPSNASYIGGKNPSGLLSALITDVNSNLYVRTQSEGPVAPGTAATFATLMAGQYNSTLPVATTGQQVAIQTDANGRILVSASPLPTTASKFSFGGVATTATTQVPVNATPYTEVTTNAAMTLVSSSANDSSAGTGARTVAITYYDQNMTGPQVVTITLNGTTAVTSPNNNMAYIEKMIVATVGSTGSNAGTVTLKSGTTTVGTIVAGQNITGWAHHYVPQGKTSYISGFNVSTNGTASNQGGVFVLKASTPTIANTPEIQISDFLNASGVSSGILRTYNSPIQVTGPARVTAYVAPTATSAYASYASFDYIDN